MLAGVALLLEAGFAAVPAFGAVFLRDLDFRGVANLRGLLAHDPP
jgi:hypothetical protein